MPFYHFRESCLGNPSLTCWRICSCLLLTVKSAVTKPAAGVVEFFCFCLDCLFWRVFSPSVYCEQQLSFARRLRKQLHLNFLSESARVEREFTSPDSVVSPAQIAGSAVEAPLDLCFYG